MRFLAILTIAACVTDAEPLATNQDAPPAPGYDNFVVGDMFPGAPTSVTWTDPGLAPGSTATLFVSPQGTGMGPCPPQLAGACAGILPPVFRVVTGTVQPADTLTGRSGTAYMTDPYVIFDVTPPPNLSIGRSFGFQALGRTASGAPMLSPAVDATSTPSFCTFIFAPVCGPDGVEYGNDCVAASSGAVVITPPGESCM